MSGMDEMIRKLTAGAVSELSWKSSDKKVATVSKKGVITAVGKGTCTITVTTENGKSAQVTVKVSK